MFLCGNLTIIDVGFLSDIFEQDFVLSSDSNDGSNIYLGDEPLIPLVVGDIMLTKTVRFYFLFTHGGEWVLIFCLDQDGLLDKGHELECIIDHAFSVHQYLGALTSHHLECMYSLFL